MREIKFRFFDKRLGEMSTGEYYSNYTFGISNEGRIMLRKNDCDDFFYIKRMGITERYIIMQFTGLTDKNGKEIYAGDIVKRSYKTYNKKSKKYLSCGVVKKVVSWTTTKEKVGWNIGAIGIYEVIGNIYSNPELLK